MIDLFFFFLLLSKISVFKLKIKKKDKNRLVSDIIFPMNIKFLFLLTCRINQFFFIYYFILFLLPSSFHNLNFSFFVISFR